MIPLKNKFEIDDIYLQKQQAVEKINKIIDVIDLKEDKIQRFASNSNTNNLIQLFTEMLKQLNMNITEGEQQNLITKISKSVTGDVKSENKEETIKIASKDLKDSHYQIDVSKDLITHKGKKIFMISCYMRDAYLGRYLIKRNFFYTKDRETFANDSYKEIIKKSNALKDRYHNEVLDISGIFAQMKKILDGVVSEIKLDNES